MVWLNIIANLVNRIPLERVLFPPRDRAKALEEFAATMAAPVAPKEASPEQKTATTITTPEPPVPQQEDIATACVPCALGHFSRSAGALNEAVRFKNEGITSNDVLDRIASVLEEQNTLERFDLTPEKLQRTPKWERKIAEEALQESRRLRHRLEGITGIEELEQAAADAAGYYKKMNRQWYRGRFRHLGGEKAEAISRRIGRPGEE